MPVTCDLRDIFSNRPSIYVQPPPKLVIDNATSTGALLAGNTCPEGSDSPYRPCPAGEGLRRGAPAPGVVQEAVVLTAAIVGATGTLLA